MWSNLYCCSVIVLALAASTHVAAEAQEGLPAPAGNVDSDAVNPFGDDITLQPTVEATLNRSTPRIVSPATPVHSDAVHQPSALGHTTTLDHGTLDRLHAPLLRRDLKIKGAQSCAASNCHGGPRPGVSQPWARRGMEYQLWVENDPHAQSWRTICGDESVDIMRRLGIMKGDRIVDQAGFDNCLACHNTVMRFNEPRAPNNDLRVISDRQSAQHAPGCNCGRCKVSGMPDDVNRFLREGVGCAGCHGPSQLWENTHFQQFWTPQGAGSEGFVEAGDLYVRARMCASCHVGDKDRDMNHDIIAAGHPALRYEMATFHAWQPKHWRDSEADDKTRYEAQLWLAGQVAATDASLALLEARSAAAHTVSEWPEFAAYDCASCHHNLELDNARRPLADERVATAIYSQWNDAGLRWLVNHRVESGMGHHEDHELIAALDAVKQVMESGAEPDALNAFEAVTRARRTLASWYDGSAGAHERAMFRSDRLGRVLASAAGKRETFRTWESAVQFYLAAVAARESWPGGWDGPLRNVADRMQFGLRYPEMIDVSRYAKRAASGGPTLSRAEAMTLGIELAGWLGPVSPEMMFDQDDDEVVTPRLRRQLREMIDDINSRWRDDAEGRPSRDAADAMGEGLEQPDVVQPEPPSREELLEQLRRRQEAAE